MAHPPEGAAAIGTPWFEQDWRCVTFVHWAVEADRIAHHFPPGTRPDTLDGQSFVGLVAFQMARCGIGRNHPVPWFGVFPETNVRLYSVDDEGRHGVRFLSMDASRLATVALARAGLQLAYTWAQMSITLGPRSVTYWQRRPASRTGRSSLAVDIGDEVAADERDRFVTARFGLHERVGHRTVWIPNVHEPWPLYSARLRRLDGDLLDGLVPAGAEPVSVLFSPGVRTTFGAPRVLR